MVFNLSYTIKTSYEVFGMISERSHYVSLIPSGKIVSALLMIFCFLLYGNTLNHDYTQDDAIVIYDNMYTTQGISGIPGILKYDTFKGFFKVEGKDKLVSGGRYRPFTLIMFALEWQLFKKQKLTETGQVAKDANGIGSIIRGLLFFDGFL